MQALRWRNTRKRWTVVLVALEIFIWNESCHAQQCGSTKQTVTCDANANWDESGWKRCIPKYCTTPGQIPNGKMSPERSRIFVGDRIRLECNVGYVLSGPGSSSPRCLANCSLEEYQTCQRVACSPITDPRGSGALLNKTVYFGDVVTVRCNENYRSSESDTVFNHACELQYRRTCQSNRVLTPEEARCIPVSCPPYDLNDQSLQCLDSTCGLAYGDVVGQVDSSEPMPLGGTVAISCFQGYRLRGDTSNKPQCSGNCQYTTGHQACTPRLCPDPTVPANARLEQTSVPFASSTSITCNGGFVVRGSTPQQCNRSVSVKCQLVANSSQSAIALLPNVDPSLCIPAPCPVFVVPANAASISPQGATTPTHGQVLTVRCSDGFRAGPVLAELAACDAPETYTVQCLGCFWQQLNRAPNNPLACLPISCSPLGDVPNGVASPSTPVRLGASAKVTCAVGFRVNSQARSAPRAANVTCLPSCNYSVSPTCEPVQCTSASAPANGVLVIDGQEVQFSSFAQITHGEAIVIKCNAGFTVQDSACETEVESACWDGDFTPKPACTPAVCGCGFGLPCEAFKDDASAVPGATAMANGSRYDVACKPGFRAAAGAGSEPALSVSCSLPTTYSAQCIDCTFVRSHRCAPTSCGAYAAANATPASSAQVFSGGSVEVTCSLGFRANSSGAPAALDASRSFTATCGSDCTFFPPTQCVPIQCTEAPAGSFSSVTGGATGALEHEQEVAVTCADGYYVAGTETCQKVFTVTCFDGQLLNKQTCSPITQSTCGCGVGNCQPYARLSTEASWEPAGARQHGQQVAITCKAGHRAGSKGGAVAFCTDAATRSATCSDCKFLSTQECLPLACPAFPPSAKVASFAPAGAVLVGNKVTGVCAPGHRYPATGSSSFSATCGADCAYFLAPSAVCAPVACAAYTLPANSEVLGPAGVTSASKMAHGEAMLLRCKPGFTVSGHDCRTAFNVTCLDTQLAPDPPQPACVPARCGCGSASCPLWTPPNASSVVFVEDGGLWSSGSVAHGTRVRLTCNSGFRPSAGPGLARCEALLRLESACADCLMQPELQCRPISCGALRLAAGEANHSLLPPPAPGAEPRVSVGTSLAVSCPNGFRLGSRTASQPQSLRAVCQSDCSFSEASVPACLRVSCPDFTLPSNSRLLNGSGAGWTGVPLNGPEGWMGTQMAGAELRVACNAGFMRRSSAAPACEREWRIACGDSGVLTGAGETCKALACGCGSEGGCAAPSGEPALNIRAVAPAGPLAHGQRFNVSCNAGYRAVDPADAWAACDADPPLFAGACSDCTAVLSRRCRPVRCGEYTSSDANVQSWSRPGLDDSDDAQVVTVGQSLIVSCKAGFRAGGACAGASCAASAPNSFSVMCGSDCTYTAGQACKPVACAAVPGIPNSDSQSPQPAAGRLFGAELVVRCLPDFRPAGGVPVESGPGADGACSKELRLRCGEDGAWSAGECVPVTCTAPPVGGGEGQIVVLGSNYSAACAEGHAFTGDDSEGGSTWGVCSANCLLQPQVRPCTPTRCAPLTEFHTSSPATVTAPPSAVAALTVDFPNLITVTCGRGLVADARLALAPAVAACAKELQLKCKATGSFELVDPATPPSLCVPALCPPFSTIDPNASPSPATRAAFGTSITVLCKDGYKPSGSGGNATFQARCGLRDSAGDACLWSVEQACEPIVCGRYSAPPRATIVDGTWTAAREYRLGEQISLRCPVGYMVAGTSCSKEFTDLCLPSGAFSSAQCVPVICKPLSQAAPPHPLPAGASRWPHSVPDTSVTFGTSVELHCPTGTEPVGGWSNGRAVQCTGDCRLAVGELEACMDTRCPPYDFFDFSAGVVSHPYFADVRNLSYGENVTVECLPGFQLDDSLEYTIPGLDILGPVRVKARKVFTVDRTKESSFSLDGEYSSIQVVVPQGSWPEGLSEPLSVMLFDATDDMLASFAQNGSTLDPQTRVGGAVINYGPEGVAFDPPIRISLPLDRSVDFGARALKVHRYDASTRSWTAKDSPTGMQNAIDLAAGVVWAQTASFSPYAALAIPSSDTPSRPTTSAALTTQAPGPTNPPGTTNDANGSTTTSTTAVERVAETPPPIPPGPEITTTPEPIPAAKGGDGINIPAIVGGAVGGLALLLCGVAGVYVQETRRKQEGKENLLSQRSGEPVDAGAPVPPATAAQQGEEVATRELHVNGGAAAPSVHEALYAIPTLFPPPTPAMAFYPGGYPGEYPGSGYPDVHPGGEHGYPPVGAAYMSPDKLAWQPPEGLPMSQAPLIEQDLSAWQPSSPEDVGQSTHNGMRSALSHVANHGPRHHEDMDGMSVYSESTLRGTHMDGDPVRGHALEIASELAALIPPGWQLCEECLQPTKIEWMTCPNCNQPLPHALA